MSYVAWENCFYHCANSKSFCCRRHLFTFLVSENWRVQLKIFDYFLLLKTNLGYFVLIDVSCFVCCVAFVRFAVSSKWFLSAYVFVLNASDGSLPRLSVLKPACAIYWLVFCCRSQDHSLDDDKQLWMKHASRETRVTYQWHVRVLIHQGSLLLDPSPRQEPLTERSLVTKEKRTAPGLGTMTKTVSMLSDRN